MPEREQTLAVRQDSAYATRPQTLWAQRSIADRLTVLRSARHLLAEATEALADAIPKNLARTRADTMAAEILPLLAACKFLEQSAASILKTKCLGRRGLPFWLAGVDSSIERVALGRVLVIAPSNYPLFLPGVQVLQALAAGNTAIWKPGAGGRDIAHIFASVMQRAGLPTGLLEVTDESPQAATNAIQQGLDKIFFTGSSTSGRMVMKAAAEQGTPVVAELSGCDAVIVLPSANVESVVAALAFGMRLNGSATCMAPRRLMLVGGGHEVLVSRLQESFAEMAAVHVSNATHKQILKLTEQATAEGGTVCGDAQSSLIKPLLVIHATPDMQIAQADIFAPVLSVMEFQSVEKVLVADEACPFGLTAAVFGDEEEARQLSTRLNVGTVLVNDLIVPTADPRIPFGGRRGSGFGVTRGAGGLLEMTAVKTVLVRRSKSLKHYEATTPPHEDLFSGAIQMQHAPGWRKRFNGLQRMVQAARKMK